MIDYKKFIHIHYVSSATDEQLGDGIKFKNIFMGDVFIPNCEVDIFQKALDVMSEWMKKKTSWFKDLIYFIFH